MTKTTESFTGKVASLRDPAWDMVKGVLIFTVVLAHTKRIGDFKSYLDGLTQFIYLFHMPAFVLISGFFFKLDSEGLGSRLKKIWQRLAIPYLLSGMVFFLAKYFASYLQVKTTGSSYADMSVFDGLGNIIAGNYGALWFLGALILLQAAILLLSAPSRRETLQMKILTRMGGIICCGLIVSYLAVTQQYFIVYFLIGMMVQKSKWAWTHCWWAIPLAIFLFVVNYEEFLYEKLMPYTIVFVISVVAGIKFLSDQMVKIKMLAEPLSCMGQHTLIILCLHPLFNPIVAYPLERGLEFIGERSGIVFMSLSSVLVCILCLLAGICIKYTKSGCRQITLKLRGEFQ